MKCRDEICALLLEENSLMEIVKLIGADALPDDQKLVIETAKVIRVGFLQQNAFHAEDTYVPLEKQLKMMQVILHLYDKSKEVIAREIPISKLLATGIFDKLTKIKYDIPNNKLEMFDDYNREIDEKINDIL
jgi:V/A-type H+-transporting ATPase subunit A